MSRSLFIFGLGYAAGFIADRAQAEGFAVQGTSSRGTLGFEDEAAVRAALKDATHILSSVPPEDHADPVLARYGADIASSGAEWVGYLSTTGVYGNTDGARVDETAPLNPSAERSARRVRDEAAWAALGPVHIFRLAGIYGPGRSAIDQLKAGRARRVIKPGQVFSRIHAQDIARFVVASMLDPDPDGAIYNLCDDEAAPPQDVIAYAAELMGIKPPAAVPYEKADLSDMAKSFYSDNRLVSNARIKARFGMKMAFPDYRAGLKALQ